MLTCKEITELVSREVDDSLSLREKVDMGMHIMMCSACRNYRSNVRFLRHVCKEAATPGRHIDEGNADLFGSAVIADVAEDV